MNSLTQYKRPASMLAEDALQAVSRARLDLVLDHPFFGALALRLRPIVDANCDEALWTDGLRMGINPEKFLALDHHQRKAMLAHEVLHCTNGHPWRQGERDAKAWAQACDLAINHILVDCGFELPDCMQLPDATQQGQAAEVIYRDLPKGDDGDGQGDGQSGAGACGMAGASGCDDQGDADQAGEGEGEGEGDGQGNQPFQDLGGIRHPDAACGSSPAKQDIDRLENDWKIAALSAAMAAKNRGTIPGDLQQLIDEIKNPKIDWRAELRRFMQRHAKNDYSWSRPNSRYMASKLYMPALHSEQMGPLAIVLDTSGSISDEELKQFMGETQSIVDELQPEFTLVIEADAAVNGAPRYESGDMFSLPAIHGRGGTDFRPAFQYLDEQGVEPACLIYLTDLIGPEPEIPPSYPVMWVCTNDRKANVGETIHLDVNAIDQ